MLFLVLSVDTIARSENDAHAFRIVRDIVIEEGARPDPRVIEHVSDGGFVLGGRMDDDRAAWATALDESGVVRWRYLLKPPNPQVGGYYPYFSGAVPTANGGVLLCGTIDLGLPRKPEINGLLVRLDGKGQLLRQQFISPGPSESEFSHVAFFDRCVPWSNGVALVGRVTRYDTDGQRTQFHWIVEANSDGAVQWQKLIPSKGDGSEPSQVRSISDGGLIISDTETIRIDAQGNLRARFGVVGRSRLVLSADAQSVPELLDCLGGQSHGQLIRLTDDLEIAAQQNLPIPPGYLCGPSQYAMQAYGLTDGSIVLFGFYYENRAHIPGIVKWYSKFSTVSAGRFALGNAPWFNAATPTGKAGEFATVRVTGAPSVYKQMSNRETHLTIFDVN